MGELVPYIDGMQKGQGYNTYLQQLCVKNAVTVEGSDGPSNPFRATYNSKFVDDYEKLAQSLKISAGATVSGWGQSGQVNASYLDRSEFESSTLTYQVEVLVQHQGSVSDRHTFNKIDTENPTKKYGDRFISDFIRGGQFLARVSITVKSASETEEIKQSAEVAFSMYGANGKVTEEVETAVSRIKKNTTIKITIYESGGSSKASAADFTTSETSDLLAVKQKADKFFDDASAGGHDYILFAVLGKYTNLSDFDNYFAPLDYSEANERSWSLSDDFTRYQALKTLIKSVPENKYKQGSSQQSELLDGAINNAKKIRDKVLTISDHPDDARTPSDHVRPTEFQLQVLRAVKTVTYIAQSRPKADDNWTDIVSTEVFPDGDENFRFEAFDFDSLIGTQVVSFGKKKDGDAYTCLIGTRASSLNGWEEESRLWVFSERVDHYADQIVGVSRSAVKDYFRVYAADQSDIDRPRKYQVFYFFVPTPDATY
ncbi:uncharacterized protein LTHEOB_11404 [Lasiodiplodia theobromae]|uniref:uncharacterized protein n=1 Tax=Lasiodiplodia theobromae TaxID=45133 RepID=UPI0015C3C8A9|nr:uncharacterized protein LTHEOB_11404 [Lasiodiplodia theobromae]KAF4537780.1 hypothetical protein LTHEOB_11404 [Lasiodiplodia theobromae]